MLELVTACHPGYYYLFYWKRLRRLMNILDNEIGNES